MSFLLLGACLTAVAFAASSAPAAAASALIFRAFRRRIEALDPARRAGFLFGLRLFPAAAAIAFTGGFFLPAFLLFEPRDTTESVGAVLGLIVTLSLVLSLRGPVRALRAWTETRRLVRGWLARSEPFDARGGPRSARLVDASFPIVAVFGIGRPRLLVARSVRDACTEDELEAVMEHERAHLRSRDNLKRMLLRGAPDPLAWFRIGAEMENAWSDAIEEAADRQTRPALALPLASALVKVARLALATRAVPVAASALYRSGTIQRRVRRLVEGFEPDPPPRFRVWPLVTGVVAASLLAAPLGLLHRLHDLTELFVAALQ